MKITKRQANTKCFNELKVGDVFQFQTGDHVFMKTERIDIGDFQCNFVDLTNGNLERACESSIVITLEHELIIS